MLGDGSQPLVVAHLLRGVRGEGGLTNPAVPALGPGTPRRSADAVPAGVSVPAHHLLGRHRVESTRSIRGSTNVPSPTRVIGPVCRRRSPGRAATSRLAAGRKPRSGRSTRARPAPERDPIARRVSPSCARRLSPPKALLKRNEKLLGNGNPHEPPTASVSPSTSNAAAASGVIDLPAPPDGHGAMLFNPRAAHWSESSGRDPHRAGRLPAEQMLAPRIAYLSARSVGGGDARITHHAAVTIAASPVASRTA